MTEGFIDAYFPIVKKRMNSPYTNEEDQYKLFRRSRYAEFTLVLDKGTKMGLLAEESEYENILVSMPNIS